MSGSDDPYKALGVSRSASQDEIRLAYRKLAKQNHPDLHPGDSRAEDRFKKIAAANEILSDVGKRGQFDRGEIDASGQARAPEPSYRAYAESDSGRRYGRPGAGWQSEDFADIFGSVFAEEHHYSLETDFLSAIRGETKRLTMPDGRVLDVKIPPGTSEGQVLRLRDKTGDMLIEIHVTPHPFFRRDGDDIRLDVPISLCEAVLGGPVEVPTPIGAVTMRIPPHTENGAELRLKGRGVPGHGGRPKGDLYARLVLVLGPADAALDEFLKRWGPDHPIDPRKHLRSEP